LADIRWVLANIVRVVVIVLTAGLYYSGRFLMWCADSLCDDSRAFICWIEGKEEEDEDNDG
jgi:hypothetical protein